MKKITRKRGLAAKISLGMNIPFVLIIALMGLVSTLQLERELGRMAKANRENIVDYSVRLVEDNMDIAVRNYLRAIAEKTRELIAFYDRQAQQGLITREQAEKMARNIILDPEYGKIGTTGYLAGVTTKGILAIHPLSQGVDASGFEFMQKAMTMRNGYLEYEWQNKGEDAPRTKAGYLAYYKPWDLMVWASSYKSEFASLVDLDDIKTMIEAMKVGDDGFLVLLDSDGTILAGKDNFTKVSRSGKKSGTVFSGLAASVNADNPSGEVRYQSTRGEVIARYEKIANTDWILVVNDFREEYMHVVRSLRIMIVVSILIASLFISVLIRVMMRKMLAPLVNIQTVTDQIAEGNLSKRISVESRDEIGDLTRFFNTVVDSFAQLVQETKKATHILLEAIHTLGSGAQEVSSTANQQAAAVKEILSTMEDSDKLSKGVAVKIQEVVKIANTTKESVEKGFSFIQESLDKMSEIRDTNGNTIGGIKVLGSQIESIWEIVNIINGIADQTKIIAFNAELEAASAGEAGKNFQIVAGEIRRLADNTVESTSEIKTKINEIQHASDKLIIASEEGTQRIKEGWDISHNIQGIFEDVLSSSEISAASAEDIARSIKMQVSSFEQIFLTLKQISEGINNFVESTRSTSESSDQLKEIADSFAASVDRYILDDENAEDEGVKLDG